MLGKTLGYTLYLRFGCFHCVSVGALGRVESGAISVDAGDFRDRQFGEYERDSNLTAGGRSGV